MSREVRIKAGWVYPIGTIDETVVTVADDGEVQWNGQKIGYVWKGSRRYSPPAYKGSRIVKYNKQVPEWHGDLGLRGRYAPRYREDTRQEVIRCLIAAASQVARLSADTGSDQS